MVVMMNLSEEQLNKIFELASMQEKVNGIEITSNHISEALIEIERKLYAFSSDVKMDSLEDKKILIADDLELSIYQLSTVLKRIGVTPRVARHKDEALSELQKAQFDCVIIDLFMPDSADGIELIKATVKKRQETGVYCKIVVISSTDDNSIIDHCYELGIDFYIQKNKNWHSKLLKYLSSSFQSEKNYAFTKYVINNNIASFFIKRFNEQKIYDALLQNINSSIYTGVKNILFDLREISSFDPENAYIFAEIYKLCAENGGSFVLVNPSNNVKDALSFAYLEDVIKYATSVEEAVAIISENSILQ